MTDSEIFAMAFPAKTERIAELRLTRPVFDSICRDFLLLFRERFRAAGNPNGSDDGYVADLVDGLTDLRGEIETMLRHQEPAATKQGE